MARENSGWGYDRIPGALANPFASTPTRRVMLAALATARGMRSTNCKVQLTGHGHFEFLFYF
jgi:hypothetical protein